LGKKTIDFIIYFFGQGFSLLVPLLILPIIVGVSGEIGLGKISTAFSIMMIFNGILDYGSYITGVKEISINRHDKEKVAQIIEIQYLSKIFLFVFLTILGLVLFLFIPKIYSEFLLYSLSFLIVFSQLINPMWILQGLEEYKLLSAINIFSKILYVLLVLFLIKNPSDYVYVNLFYAIASILAYSFGLIMVWKKNPFNLNFSNYRKSFNLLKIDFSLTVSQIFLAIYQYFPIVLINYFSNDYYAGIYRIIDQIISVFKTFFNAFFYYAFTKVCYYIDQDKVNGLWKSIKINLLPLAIVLPLLIFIFLFSIEILMFFKVTTNLEYINTILKISLVIPLLLVVSQVFRQLLLALELKKEYVRLTIFSTIFCLLIIGLFIHQIGLVGVFYAIIITEIIVILLYTSLLLNYRKTFLIK
jgi:O-antigen/teichoic acid export membrane protein